jgi:hypothetical protein
MTDLEWLADPRKQLFTTKQMTRRVGSSSYTETYDYDDEARALTAEEWTRVKQVATAHGLIWEPCSGPFGFTFALALHAPSAHAYPGIPVKDLRECVFYLAQKQFPGCWERRGPEVHNEVWDQIEKLAYTKANKAKAKLYEIELKERNYYEY